MTVQVALLKTLQIHPFQYDSWVRFWDIFCRFFNPIELTPSATLTLSDLIAGNYTVKVREMYKSSKLLICRSKIDIKLDEKQRYLSTLSQGFQDEDLGNSLGWWAAREANYCQS